LYFEVKRPLGGFPSMVRRACSTSLFFRSTSTFLLGELLGFDASSWLVCWSSACRVWSSVVSCCDCCSRF